MYIVDWNEGMSVGIKAIDDDHKRLLATINRLYKAIDSDANESELENIFSDLEKYVVEHFGREEALMKKCHYQDFDAHVQQHKAFASKVPALKAKLLNADSYRVAQEVSIYLTDWLLNHIVTEDHAAIDSFEQCGLIKVTTKRQSFMKRSLKKITNRFGFTKRMLLVMLIPLSGMLLFSSVILFNEYRHYENMSNVHQLSHLLTDVNELTHHIQIERGLSSGLLALKNDRFQNDLGKQRMTVDSSISKFMLELKGLDEISMSRVSPFMEGFKRDKSILNHFRERIDAYKVTPQETMEYYTKMIDNVLHIADQMAFFELNQELSSAISSLVSLLRFKELVGQKRGLGLLILGQNHLSEKNYANFLAADGAQKPHEDSFNQTATLKQKEFRSSMISNAFISTILEYERQLKRHHEKLLDSKKWFEGMTLYINNLHVVGNELSQEIELLIKEAIVSSKRDLLVWVSYLTIILVISLILTFMFKESSSLQIQQVADAMNRMARGDRSLRLQVPQIKDEMSQIIQAYEMSRQSLLKGDIFAQLYRNRKDMELEDSQRKNLQLEKIAFLDPLTGSVNRRKFEELANMELERAIRYEHSVSFLMLDLDLFKRINDSYGHATGDEVLKEFARLCRDSIRNVDIFARIGGEEFVIILPETDALSAEKFANRLRMMIASHRIDIDGKSIEYTVSIGVAIYDFKDDLTLEILLDRADKALYEAKESGRNRVVVYRS